VIQSDAGNRTVVLVELQGLGNGFPGECRPRLIASFLEDPYAKVDGSCKNDVPREPWVPK